MNKVHFILITFFLVFFSGMALHAQSKKKLQDKKKKLQSEIKYTEKKIKETQEQQKSSLHQLEKINKNIETRIELINTYESEIRVLESEIKENQKEIKKLESNIESLKRNYANMVYYSWVNRGSMNQTLFLLSSKNFNDAFRKTQFIKQLGERRRNQLRFIQDAKSEKEKVVLLLNENKESKTIALTEYTNETQELQKTKSEKQALITTLKSKEKELLLKVEKKKKEADALTLKINSIIEKEIKESEKKKNTVKSTNTKSTNTKTTTTSTKITGNTEGGSLSSGFESNKGKLPWPVENGFISGKFGVQPHPVLERVEIKNDGVDITTDKGANVRSVYKGEVTGVFNVDGYENVIIIRHGDYLTVYSHLSSVSVAKGNSIATKQTIGKVATNSDGKTFLNFQVRKGTTVLNPSLWISK